MNCLWKINLLAQLRLQSGDLIHTRFYSQKVARLLARLAYFPTRQHGREELIDLLWPESEPPAGRVNLRSALASLRRQLEPPGTPFGSVLVANYSYIHLNPDAFTTDVLQFANAITRSQRANTPEQKEAELQTAANLYTAELLPGFTDDWILVERERLAAQYRSIVQQLRDRAVQCGDIPGAVAHARTLVAADPLEEEHHLSLMDLLLRSGQTRAAQQQYDRLWTTSQEQLSEPPSNAARKQAQEWGLGEPEISGRKVRGRQTRRASLPPDFETTSAPTPFASPAAALKEPDQDLPLTLTRFFGREQEIASIGEHLRSPHLRLLTLTGIGGVGKTRLAIEAVRAFSAEFSGRTLFVPLADLASADLLPLRILALCRLQIPLADHDPIILLAQALQEMPTLLVLDNFEHLLAGGIPVLLRLLATVPTLKCLITSRIHLQIEGEQVLPLLPLPSPEMAADQVALSRCPSIQLLVDRAQSLRPDFQLTRRNADALVAICNQLEGLPLALELAAARLQVVTASQMRLELENRLDFLVNRKRGIGERHRSLRAALDWSFQLLSPEQRQFLTQLSVFRGGWTVEAAAAVGEEPQALLRLEELHSCSLVAAEESDEGIRFRMLETVREYCAERLPKEVESSLRQRHWQYYTELSERLYPLVRNGQDRKRWREQLETEHDNLLSALRWCRDTESDEQGLRLAGVLSYFWLTFGHTVTGWDWLRYFLSRTSDQAATPVLSQALHGAGTLAGAQGEVEVACTLFERALAMAKLLEDLPLTALILNHYGFMLLRKGRYPEALDHYRESRDRYRALGKKAGTAYSLSGMARAHMHLGELETSSTLYEESIALCQEAGLVVTLATTLCDLGELRLRQENFTDALECFETAARMHRDQDNRRELAYALEGVGEVYCHLRDFSSSEANLEESRSLFTALGDRFGIADVLRNLAYVRYLQQQYSLAAELARESLSLWQQQSLSHKVAVVTCLEVLGYVAIHHGGVSGSRWAVHLLACASALRTTADFPYTQSEREEYHRAWEVARSSVSEAEFAAHCTAGAAMSWENAVRYALA